MLALVARVLMLADVVPWPAIKAVLLDARDVVRRKIVAQSVTLVDRAPQHASLRLNRQSHGITNAGSINAKPGPVRIILQYIGTMLFKFIVVDVGMRSDGYK